jgi:hypothetical protein
MSKIRKVTTLILITFGIILLFAASEFAYTYKNRPQLIKTYYIWRLQITADKDVQKSVNYVLAGANKYNKVSKKDTNPYPSEFLHTKIDLPQNDKLKQDFKNYFENKNITNLYEEDYYSYQRLLYDLSQIAYKNNEGELFVKLIQSVTYGDISMSYWPVELANYYYSIGSQKEAFEILGICQKVEKTKFHCDQVEKTLKENKEAYQVGFLKPAIEEMFNHESLDY